MIHDLSIDGVFRKKREPLMIFSSSSVDPYGPPEYHYEALLTGDAYDRERKRFMIDYITDQDICDCCGCTIIKKPWSFEVGKLCKICEDRLNREMNEKYAREINDVDIITHFVPPKKAWDLGKDDYEPKPTDNIFLWN